MRLIFLLSLSALMSCQDYNSNSFDEIKYGAPMKEGAQKIIQNRCINCHSGYHNDWSGLTDEQWINSGYVNPGDPDNSPFITKIFNSGVDGANMPYGGGPLPDEEFEALREWILNLQ